MTLHDWIFSVYPENSAINGRWGALHIATLALCILIIAALSVFRRKGFKVRQNVILVLASCILFLEIARRVINLLRGEAAGLNDYLYLLLPRPWCAISCWFMIVAAFTKRRVICSFAAANGLLCALVFFAYPAVGFNDRYILFENVYSIATHSLLFISSITMMILEITDYRIERAVVLPQIGMLGGVFVYAFAEIYLLQIESDPLYFMPGNDVQEVLGVNHPLYLVIYVVFLAFYFSLFYIVQQQLTLRQTKRQPTLA
ncbi:MAG: hypothetical protein IJC17_02455 [Clostridia bacterium]|nr:hypothetical protein [Clostridia bacterium]